MTNTNFRFNSRGHGMRDACDAHSRGDLQVLMATLNGTDLMGRVAAANYLGELEVRDAVPPLVRCLEASDALLRMAVLKALGRIGDISVADDVLRVGLDDPDFLVRCAAAEALVALSDRRAASVLCALLDADAKHPQRFRTHFRKYA